MVERLNDAEIIATFMEPRPTVNRDMVEAFRSAEGMVKFWRWGWHYVGPSLPQQETPVEYCWLPRKLTLDALHEVEARLTDGQWHRYKIEVRMVLENALGQWSMRRRMKDLIHLSPEQKIAALAAVLRPIVEANHAE